MKSKKRESASADQIRERFKELGPVPINRLARDLLFDHPVDQETIDRWAMMGCQDQCRVALKQEYNGIPFAKPISGGKNAVWKQIPLFSKVELAALITREFDSVEADCDKLLRLIDYYELHFGESKEISVLKQMVMQIRTRTK